MASPTYDVALWEELEVEVMDVGKRLLRLPSSTDEILILLEEGESILAKVCQGIPNSEAVGLYPIMAALITDKLLRHADVNIQVGVASCLNEITRITAPTFPYDDEQMKEIFQLFMVALKQLSTETGANYVRALRILHILAAARSCLIMLDLEIDAMIVEMFQLYFNIIRSNHPADIFKHMETIMTMIIEESDEVSLELLKALLDSVRMENKNISPSSWELGNTVLEKCATKLRPYLREAVKFLDLKVDDYAAIVASLCQATPNGQNMVAKEVVTGGSGVEVSKLDEIPEAKQEDCTPKVKDRNGVDYKNQSSAESVQLKYNNNAISGTEVENSAKIVQSEKDTRAQQSKRARKSNSLKRPEEGYRRNWTRGGNGISKVSSDSNNKRKRSSNTRKKTTHKVVESRVSKLANAKNPPEKEETSKRSHVDYGEEMVNVRIMVWWPLDETFYTGTVEAFDPLNNKHKIKYDDDEEEILDLREERWELFDEQARQIQSSQKQELQHPSAANEHVNRIHKKMERRKAGSPKKQHSVASSSKGLKSEGHSLDYVHLGSLA